MIMKVIKELFLFGIAGVIGFVVDAGVLYLLKPVLGIYAGRIVSFFMAVLMTWIFNRNVTFRQCSAGRGLMAEFVHYLSLMIVGGAINLGVYYLLIGHYALFHQWPVAAVAAGSVAGMAANFLSSRFLLYKKRHG
ncbi:GtrA family protein [Pantoea sp.]|uniref:GtrA family protein n=2 Tax=Pantoea sp. TaxID=69393 RepID=UPI00289AC954|nr:GtrA family protein [Pantoea sp.]